MSFLPSFFSREPHLGDSFLAVDMGTSAIKVGIFLLKEDLFLQGYGECAYSEEVMRVGEIVNSQEIITCLKEALSQASSQLDEMPKEVIVGVSGEAVMGFSTKVRLRRASGGVPIEAEEVEGLQKKIEEVSLQKAHNLLATEFGEEKIGLDILSSKVFRMVVDGKAVVDPVGMLGERLELYQFSVYALDAFLSQVQKAISQAGLRLITVVSLMNSLSELLSVNTSGDLNAIVVDIGGSVTEVGVLYGGSLVASRSHSLGGFTFSKAIANVCEVSLDEAELMKIRFIKGELAAAEKDKVHGALDSVLDLWLGGLSLTLHEIPEVKTFPSLILLTGKASQMPQIKEILVSTPWARELPFSGLPKVQTLNLKAVRGILFQSGTMEATSSLGVLSIGLIGRQLQKGS